MILVNSVPVTIYYMWLAFILILIPWSKTEKPQNQTNFNVLHKKY